MEVLLSPISLGVMLGLIVGKILGISIFSRILVKTGLAELPDNANWSQIYGVSILAAIGFTMSLFISELAYQNDLYIEEAKSAIIVSSAIAALVGLLVIKLTNKEKPIDA